MPAIMERFPGPITGDAARIAAIAKLASSAREPPIRVSECGPLLRLIAGQRRVALPFVLREAENADEDRRFWAMFLLTELVYTESAECLVPRLFDQDTRTRNVARLAARSLAEIAPSAIVEHLGHIALGASEPSAKRVETIEVLGELREPAGVPSLVTLLTDADELIAQAAHLALVTTTRQDFGDDQRKWLAWWGTHSSQHRIEWLIDALMNEEAHLRHAAGEELKAITKEYFGYYDDLPRRERERAQQRYRDWWSTEGRARFRRA
jgi:HEAT repeat protein